MKITIKRVNNGAVVEYKGFYEANGSVVYAFEKDNLEELQSLLWDILQQVGPSDGKYSKERISIKLVHGNGYKCKDKKCKICKEVY